MCVDREDDPWADNLPWPWAVVYVLCLVLMLIGQTAWLQTARTWKAIKP